MFGFVNAVRTEDGIVNVCPGSVGSTTSSWVPCRPSGPGSARLVTNVLQRVRLPRPCVSSRKFNDSASVWPISTFLNLSVPPSTGDSALQGGTDTLNKVGNELGGPPAGIEVMMQFAESLSKVIDRTPNLPIVSPCPASNCAISTSRLTPLNDPFRLP